MIRHMVFFSGATEEDVEKIHDGLQILKDIPHVEHLEISKNLNVDKLSDAPVDVVVYGEFKDQQQLDAYKAHPIYRQSIFTVRPIREVRTAADITAVE